MGYAAYQTTTSFNRYTGVFGRYDKATHDVFSAYFEDVERAVTNLCLFPGHYFYNLRDCEMLVENWEQHRCKRMLRKMRDRSTVWRESHYFHAMRKAVRGRLETAKL